MKRIAYITVALVLVLLAACSKDENSNIPEGSVLYKLKSSKIVSASNDFGFELLNKTDSLTSGKNAFISPFSALQALSMTYNGANGQTKTEMANTLGFSNYSDVDVNEYNQSLSSALLEADVKVQFEIANSIWYKLGFVVIQKFIDTNTSYYNSEVKQVNFANPQTLTAINNWCKVKTHEKIPTILDEIPEDAVMYLINAIYFKGTWQYAFDITKTTNASFRKEDGSQINHQQMAMETELNYYSTEDFAMVELPYGNGAFNFVMALPSNNKELSNLVKTFDAEKWKNATKNMTKTKVVVKMPKFKFEFKSLLNQPLIDMGMPTAFIDFADFSGITPGGGIYISRVIHKTFIELNEKGTEAAAVTAVEMFKMTTLEQNLEQVKWFIADHPFLYAITEKSTGAILFIGKMMDPTEESTEMK